MRLIFLSAAWLLGILAGAVFTPSPAAFFLSLLPAPLLFFPGRRRFAFMLSLAVVAFLCGSLRYAGPGEPGSAPTLKSFNGQKIVLRAVVCADPDVRDTTTRLRLAAEAVEVGGVWQNVSGAALAYVPRYPAYRYGDMLEVSGSLSAPAAFDGFDYAGYLAKQNVYSVIFYPETLLTSAGGGNALLSRLYAARSALADSLARALPEPQASLAQGILLGLRSGIPKEVNGAFTLSGTTHLLAISGLNLTILTGLLLGLFIRLLGRRHYYYVWLTAGAVWLYVALCGASPSVVRAACMASVFLLAELAGRQKSGGPALFLAAAVMAGANPRVLWDVSFQLSFLAMCGLVYVYPLLGEYGKSIASRLPDKLQSPAASVVDSLAVSLAATITVWPALAVYFGGVALAGPVATILAAPALPPVIVLSLLTALTGLVSPPAALVPGALTWLLIAYIMLVAGAFAHVPVVGAASPGADLVAGYYFALGVLLWWLNRLKSRRFARELARP